MNYNIFKPDFIDIKTEEVTNRDDARRYHDSENIFVEDFEVKMEENKDGTTDVDVKEELMGDTNSEEMSPNSSQEHRKNDEIISFLRKVGNTELHVAESLWQPKSHDVSECAEPQSPWPFLDKWIKCKNKVGDNYTFQCLSCLPKINEVRVNKGTKANLKSHFNRIHPDAAKLIDEACRANAATGGRGRSLADGGSSGSARSSSGNRSSKRQRQMPIAETFDITPQSSGVSQPNIDVTILAFVVDNMLPCQIVDSHSFRTMVRTLNPNKEVPSGRTLARKIINMYREMKDSLIKKLKDAKWVSTTADCWRAKEKTYLAMTVHWLDPETRERNMGVLTCQRLEGTNTHELLARAIDNIHSQFGIKEKVIMTTTDNAANFRGSFVPFPNVIPEEEDVPLLAPDFEADPSEAPLQELIRDRERGKGSVQFIPFEDLEKGELGVRLIKQRCGAHTLNLVASCDVTEKEVPVVFKKAYRRAIAKAKALWNNLGTSTVFADNLQAVLKKRLSVPTDSGWTSLYDGLLTLNKVLEEQKPQLHRCMDQQGNMTLFAQVDVDFLAEYTKVMAPVANALEQLEGGKQGYLGCLIPTLIVAKKKLVLLQASDDLRLCVPLVDALLRALDNRFGSTFEDEESLLATAFHPKFKLKWMGAFQHTRHNRTHVKTLMERKVEEYLCRQDEMSTDSATTDVTSADDYYSSIIDDDDDYIDDAGGQTHHLSPRCKAVHIVKLWLEAKITDSLSSSAFNSEKSLIELFVRYNTALSSSAAVERLFSLANDVNKANRSCLSHHTFNLLMFTKGNLNANLI